MELGPVFYVVAALWALAVILNLIMAARYCRAIEMRSGLPTPARGLPGYASIIPVALNRGVALDDETQALRWEMNKRLLTIIGGFVAFFIFVRIWSGM